MQAIAKLIASYDRGGKLMICGNGGSAADCEHIVGELMKGFSFAGGHCHLPTKTIIATSCEKDAVFLGKKLQYGRKRYRLSAIHP